jgi:hypothetical protein
MDELFAEVRGQVRTLSSVEGVREMISFPFAMLRNLTGGIIKKNSGEIQDKQQSMQQ